MSNTVINTNVTALNSHRAILGVGNSQSRSAERLSTGMRINRAADDAAGLAISEGMRNQIRGLDQAVRNSQDGISLIQTAEGALEEIHRMAERARVLTVQAANSTYSEEDRGLILLEVEQLVEDMNRIVSDTEFNGMTLLDDSNETFTIQAGANSGQFVEVSIGDVGQYVTGLDSDLWAAGDSTSEISDFLDDIDSFIHSISSMRANLGAYQNRLEHTINNLSVASENLSAANSRIRDTDMAAEMMQFTQANVLQQAGMSMLAQANMAPNNVLQLLG